MKSIVIYILGLLFIINITLKAQEAPLIPKSPGEREDILSTFALKVKNEPQLYTGQIGISIPIFNYSDGEFNFPITLSHTSKGYRTNDFIDYVGLGWNLNAGGIITKTVSGVEDTYGGGWGLGGFLGLYHSKEAITHNYEDLFKNGNIIGKSDPDTKNLKHYYDYYFLKGQTKLETTPDRFDFKFLNYSGSFYLGIDTIYVVESNTPHGEFRIEAKMQKEFIYGPSSPFNDAIEITITTGDGDIYIFLPHNYFNRVGLHSVRATLNRYVSPIPCSTWLLKEIRRQNGNIIKLEYSAEERYCTSTPYTLGTFQWGDINHFGDGNPIPEELRKLNEDDNLTSGFAPIHSESKAIRTGILNRVQYYYPIKKIWFDKYIYATFNYEDRIQETPNSDILENMLGSYPEKKSYVKRLKSVDIEYQGATITKTYNFKYSYSKMSDKSYPKRPVFFLKEIITAEEDCYRFDYYGEDSYFPPVSHSIDHWGFNNNGGVAVPLPDIGVDKFNIETTRNEPDLGHAPDFSGALIGALKTITYPTQGYTHFYYESHSSNYCVTKNLHSNNKQSLQSKVDENIGGIRIKKVVDYSSSRDSTYRSYIYKDLSNSKPVSSGILLHNPRYSRKSNKDRTNFGPLEYDVHGNFTFTEDPNHIGYSKVYEYFPDNSYKLYEFSDYRLVPDSPIDDNLIKYGPHDNRKDELWDNFYTKFDSRHLDRGKLIKLQYCSSEGKLTYSKEFIYDFNKKSPYFGVAGKSYTHYYLQKKFVQSSPLLKTIETTYPSVNNDINSKIVKSIEYKYNTLGQIIEEKKDQSDKSYIIESTQFISDIPKNKMDPILQSMINKNMKNAIIRTQIENSTSGLLFGKKYNYQQTGASINILQTESVETNIPLKIPKFNFDQYLTADKEFKRDKNDNIIQVTAKDGITIVYLWSADGKIISEVKNISIEEIKKIPELSQIEKGLSILKLPTTAIDKLYLIKKAHVTVFEYKPLTGVVSVTNSSRLTTFYEYNDFGRLTKIFKRDTNGVKQPIFEYEYVLNKMALDWDHYFNDKFR